MKPTTTLAPAQRPHTEGLQSGLALVRLSADYHGHDDETVMQKLADAVRANDHDAVYAIAKCLVDGESSSRMAVPQLMSVEEIAMRFNLCTRSIWRLVDAGELPQPIHVGHARRWYAVDVENYLRKLTEKRDGIQRRRRG